MDDHPQPWVWADEKYAFSEHDLSFLLGKFAWMDQEIEDGGLFATPCSASGGCVRHGLHQTPPASANASLLFRISSPIS